MNNPYTNKPDSSIYKNDGVLTGDRTVTTGPYSVNFAGAGNFGIDTEDPTARLHIAAGTAAAGTAPFKMSDGVLQTTPEAGTFEYDGSRFYLTAQTVRRIVSVCSNAKLSDTTVANTTDETEIYSADIAADEYLAGKVYLVALFGSFSTANASDVLTFRLKLDGTTITVPLTPKTITNQPWHVCFKIIIRTVGVSGTFVACISLQADNTSYDVVPITGSIDTTVLSSLSATVQWDNALAGNTVTCMGGHLEEMN